MSPPPGPTRRCAVAVSALCAAFLGPISLISSTALADVYPEAADEAGPEPLQPVAIAVEVEAEEPKLAAYDRHPGTGHVLLTRLRDDVRVNVDGRLDEDAWQGLEAHGDFRLIDPDTLEPASLPTEVLIFYTERGLYVGARMTQDPDTLVEYLSGRDQGFLNRDYFSFTLDTSGEGRYGFWGSARGMTCTCRSRRPSR